MRPPDGQQLRSKHTKIERKSSSPELPDLQNRKVCLIVENVSLICIEMTDQQAVKIEVD